MWNFIGKSLQLAVLADIEYANAKANGTASLLLPNNFETAIAAIAEIFHPPVPVPVSDPSAPPPAA